MSVCFTLVSLSALMNLFSVQPSRTVHSDATMDHRRVSLLVPHRGILCIYIYFFLDGLTKNIQEAPHLRYTLLSQHALFIFIRRFVTDSFSYPLAAIFHMAWFTMPLHALLVDQWLLRGIILAHIPMPRVQSSALRGLTAFIQLIGSFI